MKSFYVGCVLKLTVHFWTSVLCLVLFSNRLNHHGRDDRSGKLLDFLRAILLNLIDFFYD